MKKEVRIKTSPYQGLRMFRQKIFGGLKRGSERTAFEGSGGCREAFLTGKRMIAKIPSKGRGAVSMGLLEGEGRASKY